MTETAFVSSTDMTYDLGTSRPLTVTPTGRLRVDASSTPSTDASPNVVRQAQGTPTSSTKTLVANTAQTVISASATTNGARILNWTASPVYLDNGVTGTPASTAPSDYVPAAASGVPGQYETPFAPKDGMRAVGASAGALTVIVW